MKQPNDVTAKNKINELEKLLRLKTEEAEKHKREQSIALALERVREKAMAMRNSKDISDATAIVFNELTRLGIKMLRCGIYIMKEPPLAEIWSTRFSSDKKEVAEVVTGYLNTNMHPMNKEMYAAWKNKKDYFTYELTGDEVKEYYKLLAKEPGYHFPKTDKYPEKQIANSFNFNEGGIFAYTKNKLTGGEKQIFQRFTKVFSHTYRRYQDIIKAEAQVREAVKQASLDRVRGEIASMRNSEDLNRITPVIWRELQALEVPFIRCGVFIVNEENEKVQVYLTTPDGKSLGALNLSVDENEITKTTVEHWRKKRIFKTHWSRKEFIDWTKSMMKLGQVQNAETYQGSSTAPESLNLHFVPFKQGMLYVGDVSPLPDEKIELVKTLAESFSIAYARYEDFKNLEEAKNKIEKTLLELKQAQTQLIQSEKMASLGELTAGIAHEIQNPLNFVNNFSELSNELLEELKEEIENGNIEEVKILIEDVIQNLDKIKNHGQRASSIVKGMLLHSRGSSGHKEPTDINALCDEYLRLSYHGFRAKDKSFNADFKLETDSAIPKIDIVPQDIGRVLLNLINNAFYAVQAPPPPEGGIKERGTDYKPIVIVSTSSFKPPSGGLGVEIRVKDNGSGIPDNIKEKIFHPFFSTKPTGQGTGLGLSLSYDIVKAHGGTISVNSTQNVGTEFIVSLLVT